MSHMEEPRRNAANAGKNVNFGVSLFVYEGGNHQ